VFANNACCVSVSAAGMRETALTYLTLVPIAGGVVIASGGEPLFNLFGFTACIIATCCRALKSVVQVGLRLQSLPTMVMAVLEQQHIALASDYQPRSLAQHAFSTLGHAMHGCRLSGLCCCG
jgi:hypothetical protein